MTTHFDFNSFIDSPGGFDSIHQGLVDRSNGEGRPISGPFLGENAFHHSEQSSSDGGPGYGAFQHAAPNTWADSNHGQAAIPIELSQPSLFQPSAVGVGSPSPMFRSPSAMVTSGTPDLSGADDLVSHHYLGSPPFSGPATASLTVAPDPASLLRAYRSSIAAHHTRAVQPAAVRWVGSPLAAAPALKQSVQGARPPQQGSPSVRMSNSPLVSSIQERRRVARHTSVRMEGHSDPIVHENPISRAAAKGILNPSASNGRSHSKNGESQVAPSSTQSQTKEASEQPPRPSREAQLRSHLYSPSSHAVMSPVYHGEHGTLANLGGRKNKKSIDTLYSSSGFDLLGALNRVASRPNPRVSLGPVDLSCSFTVSDATDPEQPIIYVSETFCRLTGYSREEIIGRNCRFLQAPDGYVVRGSERQFTDNHAVDHIRHHVGKHLECQASLINYRKNGIPFINLVTIVPISWAGDGKITHLVGFQVDLIDQPGAILERMADGSYAVNYSTVVAQIPSTVVTAGPLGKHKDPDPPLSPAGELAELIANGADETREWSRLLLDNSQDLIFVLSLKGIFLYISPSVRRLLGYEPEEVIGRSISEFCHPSDVVPVFRELKDSTSNSAIAASARQSVRDQISTDRGVVLNANKALVGGPSVDLIMRLRSKTNGHCWVESVGKLHLEQGKGRKVVISSGRVKPTHDLPWPVVKDNIKAHVADCWVKVSKGGLILGATSSVVALLGYSSNSMRGRSLADRNDKATYKAVIQSLRSSAVSCVLHDVEDANGARVSVLSTFYPSRSNSGTLSPYVITHIRRACAGDRDADAIHSQQHIGAEEDPSGAQSKSKAEAVASLDISTESVFKELSTHRSSSWVFELHQLKNTNRRLKERLRAAQRRQQADSVSSIAIDSQPDLPVTVSSDSVALAPSASSQQERPQPKPAQQAGKSRAEIASEMLGNEKLSTERALLPRLTASTIETTQMLDCLQKPMPSLDLFSSVKGSGKTTESITPRSRDHRRPPLLHQSLTSSGSGSGSGSGTTSTSDSGSASRASHSEQSETTAPSANSSSEDNLESAGSVSPSEERIPVVGRVTEESTESSTKAIHSGRSLGLKRKAGRRISSTENTEMETS